MENKKLTSDVEPSRLECEEPFISKGQPVYPSQIWRDGKLLPSTAPELTASSSGYDKGIEYHFNKQQYLQYYYQAPLWRVSGTYTFHSSCLINVIPPKYDPETQSYKIILYDSNKKALAFGRAQGVFDAATGNVTFTKDIAKATDLSKTPALYVSCYQYIGKSGFFGDDGLYFPFSDEIDLLYDQDDPNAISRFAVRGGEGTHVYVLPKQGDFTLSCGVTEAQAANEDVLVTTSTINAVMDKYGILDGGTFLKG